MKQAIICLLILAAGCNSFKSDTNLEGVYTGAFEHEFGKNDDTLIVKKANDGNGVYQVTRHTGLIKKLDGKRFPKVVLKETLLTEYNSETQVLTDVKQGRKLIWDRKSLTLQLGNTKYQKMEN